MTFKNLQKWLPRLYSFVPYHLASKRALPPAHVFFEVTYRCNLRCDMCHYLEIIEDTETNRKYEQELSPEQVKNTIDRLPRWSLITFTGGEAFMKQDFYGILERAIKKHKVHVITNGTTLTERTVEFLIHNRVRGLLGSGMFYIGVSLEGHEALHDRITQVPGSFRKTTEGLERLVQARGKHRFPFIHLTCVIGRDNVQDLVPLYEYASGLGVEVMNFALKNPATYNHHPGYDDAEQLRHPAPPVEEIPSKLLRDVLDQLEDKAKRSQTKLRFSPNYVTKDEIVRYYSNKSSYQNYRCYIPWTKAAVSAYGDVFSCPHVPLGSIHEKGGTIPWQNDKARRFRRQLKEERIFPGCLGCCQSEYIGP